MPALPPLVRRCVVLVATVGTKAAVHVIMVMFCVLVTGVELLTDVVVSFADVVVIVVAVVVGATGEQRVGEVGVASAVRRGCSGDRCTKCVWV